ncbi:hypothetical protein AAKU55_005364 [Oxalobacteraceae bacterium GrIS 1.11]
MFTTACIRAIGVVAVALSALTMTNPAAAEPAVRMSQQCQGVALSGPPDQGRAVPKVTHQYMLLIMFKKGKGGPYFGNPAPGEYGCIGDVKPNAFPPEPTGSFITAANCPNDCVYPRDNRSPLNNGHDALGKNPWGIVSSINSEVPGGGPGRFIEVWEMAVRDKCHADALYAYLTLPGGPLVGAIERGDYRGEILVGYPKATHEAAKVVECFKK